MKSFTFWYQKWDVFDQVVFCGFAKLNEFIRIGIIRYTGCKDRLAGWFHQARLSAE